jgi:hypothetical protein
VAHEKLLALGYTGSERTTRRAVARVKAAYRLGRVRVHRPWVTEPGMWLQYDFGDGPVIDGVKTVLFVAWLAWSGSGWCCRCGTRRCRVVFAALDVTFRRLGGVPTYVLTDNEKTVTVEHIAGIPVRNRQMVAFAGTTVVTVHTCVPPTRRPRAGRVDGEDRQGRPGPQGHEPAPSVRLVRRARGRVRGVLSKVNTRVHRVTKRARWRCWPRNVPGCTRCPRVPAHGRVRGDPQVPANTPMVTFESGSTPCPTSCSVSHRVGAGHGAGTDEQVVIVHVGAGGPVEVARHARATPGTPRITTSTSRPSPRAAGAETAGPNAAEAEFLDLGEGARLWLIEAAAAGTPGSGSRWPRPWPWPKLFDPAEVDWALGHAAVHGRFAEADLASILDHHATPPGNGEHRAGETQPDPGHQRLGRARPPPPSTAARGR